MDNKLKIIEIQEKIKLQKIKLYLKLIRVKHYIKNLLIFLPLIFSMKFYSIDNVIKTFINFMLFSFICSIVYIINDINDKDKDRQHSKKCNRPIASGKVTIKEAYGLIVFLITLIIFTSIVIKNNIYTYSILLIYLVLNICYSKFLKNIPIVDIICLVIGFVLRVIYGAFIINVEVSNWLYLTIISLSFYLALGKRRNELQFGTNTREVLKFYNRDFLDKNMYMFLSLMIVFYSMWSVDSYNIIKFGNNLIYTIPILLVIVMKYSLNIEGNLEGDPVEVLLSDNVLIILIIIYIIIMGLIVVI